jgi:hypothetical protein
MTAPTARASAPRKRRGSKQKNKQISARQEQISARQEQASARRSGKAPKLARKPRTPLQPERQNRCEHPTHRERANGKGRNHPDEQLANQQRTPPDAPDSVGEGSAVEPEASRAQLIRSNKQTSAAGGRVHEDLRSASSQDPQQRRQLKETLDEPKRANGVGLPSAYRSMLHPVQATAIAHWQFWARAIATYQRAWIFTIHGK